MMCLYFFLSRYSYAEEYGTPRNKVASCYSIWSLVPRVRTCTWTSTAAEV